MHYHLRIALGFLLVFSGLSGSAQKIVVPEQIIFAEMKLTLTEGAQAEVQQQVDYLLRHPGYYQMKVDRADLYFPIVERVLQEEGLPEDFKYLVLQESGLVSDAVSTSNAVGFWQFKKETATDYGLTVTNEIDERKHIIQSTRGAARYLIKNNLYYRNWVLALLSYNLGFTGAKSMPEAKFIGQQEMLIEKNTHVYIHKFLAHKLAFENAVGKNNTPSLVLKEYPVQGGATLFDLAQTIKIDPVELERYNKWAHNGVVPSDKPYTVLLPLSQAQPMPQPVTAAVTLTPEPELFLETPQQQTLRNGLKAIIAQTGDTKEQLAFSAGLSVKAFLNYNDLSPSDEIVAGEFYYIQPKQATAEQAFYVVKEGETIHQIAQRLGIKEKALREKNHLSKNEQLMPGRILWAQQMRPISTPVAYEALPEQPSKAPGFAAIYASNQAIDSSIPPVYAQGKTTETDTALFDLSMLNDEPETMPAAKTERITPNTTPAPPLVKTITEPRTAKNTYVHNADPAPYNVKPTTAVPASASSTASQHTVQAGETLYSISKKYSTSVERLTTLNKLASPALWVGQTLLLPEKETAAPTVRSNAAVINQPIPTETAVMPKAGQHQVLPGETMYQIARKYNVTVIDLLDWNHRIDTTLKPGEVLKIAAGK